jgi:hypothetical protein
MLFPGAHPWTLRQKRLIASAAVLAIILGCALIYGYERYYRGPSAAALYGTWQDMTPAMDSVTYYRFKPDGTFDLMADSMGEIFVVVTGTWYAGGQYIYWRFPADWVGPMRPLVWCIDDVAPNQIRVRPSRHGPITIWKRVDIPSNPKHLTNRSSQPLAVPVFSFHMPSTLNSAAKLAPASGG